MIEIGEVAALYRYPVKSMAGEALALADVGWHGIAGDRRFGLRRIHDRGGFPWLNASKLPEMMLYTPRSEGRLATHVRTPEGEELAIFGEELATDLGRRHGSPVEMMYLDRGIFDEAAISVITSATVDELGRRASLPADVRRFRPNILLASTASVPFEEDQWIGGVLSFGDTHDTAITVTNYDERCMMVNLDPDTARPDAEMLKTIVRERDNKAGVYASVTRRGRIAVGQRVFFAPAAARE